MAKPYDCAGARGGGVSNKKTKCFRDRRGALGTLNSVNFAREGVEHRGAKGLNRTKDYEAKG